jgi:thiol-disulfide isomerase/thioredoxin
MIKNKPQVLLIAVLISCLGLVGWFTYTNYLTDKSTETTSAAFNSLVGFDTASYTDMSGNAVDLSAYLGKVLVINSWASWSPSSSGDLTSLSTLSQRYSDEEVVFLAINRGEPRGTAAAFMKAYNINTEVILVLDPEDRFYKSIEGFSMPETIIYDRFGNLIQHQRGKLNLGTITQMIDRLIAN